MKSAIRHKGISRIGFAALFCCMAVLCPYAAVKPDKTEQLWKVRENLVQRLQAEWYKIALLNRDLDAVAGILDGMREFELYPEGVTGLNDDGLVLFDRRIENIDRQRQEISAEISALKPALSDALSILREMVTGTPVEDMFTVLEQGDLERIREMIEVRHRISALWLQTDTLLVSFGQAMRISVSPRAAQESQGEFLAIIAANLGRQSEQYVAMLELLKDSLAVRATPVQAQKMLAVDLTRVTAAITKGSLAPARSSLESLARRYPGADLRPGIMLPLAKVLFLQGEYVLAMQTTATFPDKPEYRDARRRIVMQSMYLQGKYNQVWEMFIKTDIEKLSDADRNQFLWMAMESALATGQEADFPRLASLLSKNAPYAMHVMYTLAGSYMKRGNWRPALSVLESAKRFKAQGDVDREMVNRITVAIAQSNYELGNYDKALTLFFAMVNDNVGFEEALNGIVWCYVRLGMFSKAEASLRKLINQSPQSPLAAEGILLMSQQFTKKAESEWTTLTSSEKQSERLKAMMTTLEMRSRADSTLRTSPAYSRAKSEIRSMQEKLAAQRYGDYTSISSAYDKAVDICDMIVRLYGTGSFQEASLSSKREKLLYGMDSVLAEINGTSVQDAGNSTRFTAARKNIDRIKSVVRRATIYKAELQLGRYRWERDYLDWAKTQVKVRQDQFTAMADTARDSTARAMAQKQQQFLAGSLDSLVRAAEAVRMQWHIRLVGMCDSLLYTKLDSVDEPYFRYHLGELYYSDENERYIREYQAYEDRRLTYDTLLARFRRGAIDSLPQEPAAPVLDHSASIGEFSTALTRFPNSEMAPAIRYGLAWCYSDLGNQIAAVAQMDTLANNYKDHPYAPQAWMYIGEYRFDNGDLVQAAAAYKSVMNYPASRWFDESLYKFAWTQYRLSNPEKAISSFLALVELGGKVGGRPMLEKESMDYIAISFSESDLTGERGLERATRFLSRLGDDIRGTQILYRLARVYQDQGRYEIAKKTYTKLLDMYPANPQGPLVEKELLAVLERDLPDTVINRRKLEYVTKYNHAGAWAAGQRDTTVRRMGDSLSAQMLYDVGIGYHQIALQKNDTAQYNRAARTYADYIRLYPKTIRTNECHYNYAEILFAMGDYFRAAEEYMAVSQRYPDSKYRETAAWNAIVASQNLLKSEKQGGRQ